MLNRYFIQIFTAVNAVVESLVGRYAKVHAANRGRRGATMLEYVLLAAFAVVVFGILVTALQGPIRTLLNRIGSIFSNA